MDTIELSQYDTVEVKSLNFSALIGAGILHTKLWIVDRLAKNRKKLQT
jgi:hypothetical protein